MHFGFQDSFPKTLEKERYYLTVSRVQGRRPSLHSDYANLQGQEIFTIQTMTERVNGGLKSHSPSCKCLTNSAAHGKRRCNKPVVLHTVLLEYKLFTPDKGILPFLKMVTFSEITVIFSFRKMFLQLRILSQVSYMFLFSSAIWLAR